MKLAKKTEASPHSLNEFGFSFGISIWKMEMGKAK